MPGWLKAKFSFLVMFGLLLFGLAPTEVFAVGYDNTPMLPDSEYRVHGSKRPKPPIVTPGKASTQEKPGTAPSDAIVLFDGKDLSQWTGGKWKIENGELVVGKKSLVTKEKFGGHFQLHIEWSAPTPPKGDSQGRGNSGVFLPGGYEVQVLDSYDNPTYADGQAAALYGQTPPMVNAMRKPGEWNVYDIIFESPEFKDKECVKPAFVTVIHNGVVVHHKKAYIGKTTHKKVAKYAPHETTGQIRLQDHGNPVRFRNIWIRPLKGYDTGKAAE